MGSKAAGAFHPWQRAPIDLADTVCVVIHHRLRPSKPRRLLKLQPAQYPAPSARTTARCLDAGDRDSISPFTDIQTMSPATISSPTPTNNRRSPPPPVSPPAIPPVSNTRGTNAPPASDRGSLDSPIAQPDSPPPESPRITIPADEDILWMPPGNMHHTRSIAYATITLTQDAGATNPSFFIRVAISSVPNVVAVRFSLFPSSHGCLGLLFDSLADVDVH